MLAHVIPTVRFEDLGVVFLVSVQADFANQFGFAVPFENPEHERYLKAILATFTFQDYCTQQDLPGGCFKANPLILRKTTRDGVVGFARVFELVWMWAHPSY